MSKAKMGLILCIAMVMVMAFSVPSWSGNTGKINLNTATAVELTQLKGIGQKYAERIVKHREKNGPFEKKEDLMNVPGIGAKIWKKNKDRIVVE
jgi:competence protein ComEA